MTCPSCRLEAPAVRTLPPWGGRRDLAALAKEELKRKAWQDAHLRKPPACTEAVR